MADCWFRAHVQDTRYPFCSLILAHLSKLLIANALSCHILLTENVVAISCSVDPIQLLGCADKSGIFCNHFSLESTISNREFVGTFEVSKVDSLDDVQGNISFPQRELISCGSTSPSIRRRCNEVVINDIICHRSQLRKMQNNTKYDCQ